eukprot:8545199-Ditylum_brightwellii.AAC.1
MTTAALAPSFPYHLSTKTSDSSNDDKSITSSFGWEHLDEEEIGPDIKDEDKKPSVDHRSDEGK